MGDFLMITLKTHNILDYVIAAALVAAPYIFGFSDIIDARNLYVGIGLLLAFYSSITDYRFSLAKFIPIETHLLLDVLSGLILMIGPYTFRYRTFLTTGEATINFLIGLGMWAFVALTRSRELIAADRIDEQNHHDDIIRRVA